MYKKRVIETYPRAETAGRGCAVVQQRGRTAEKEGGKEEGREGWGEIGKQRANCMKGKSKDRREGGME